MATSYTSVNSLGIMLTKVERKPLCAGGAVMSYASKLIQNRARLDYVHPESRVYPTTPLYLNPTTRPKVYRNYGYYGCRRTDSKASVVCSGVTVPYDVETYAYESPLSTILDPVVSDSSLVIKAKLKIKKDLLNLADTIGEYRECLDLLSLAGSGLVDGVEKVRSARAQPVYKRGTRYFKLGNRLFKYRKSMASQLSRIPAAVVVADFGLAPSVSLIDDVVTRWNNRLREPFYKRIAVKMSAKTSQTVPGVYGGEASLEASKVRLGLYVVRLNAARAGSEYTSGNILEAVWAGIPFSFLIDKFIDVGGWLSSFDALEGVTVINGTSSNWVRQVTNDERLMFQSSSTYRHYIVRPAIRHYTSYERVNAPVLTQMARPEWRPSGSFRTLRDIMGILCVAIGRYFPAQQLYRAFW